MKTAISVEDRLLEEVDRTAKELGISRSRVFSLAAEGFLKQRRQGEVLEQLNRVYAGESEPVMKKLKAKFRTAIRDKW